MRMIRRLFLLLLSITFFSTMSVNAAIEPDYTVENVFINSSIDIIGSIHVTEVYVIEGALNGYAREIAYKNSSLPDWEEGNVDLAESSFYNARGVNISKISSFSIEEKDIGWELLNKAYEKFEKVDSASAGDSGVYTEEIRDDSVYLRIYNPNSSGYVAYVIDYYVNQAVVLHNDVAEFYWQFVPFDSDDIKELQIQVTVPSTCTQETFRVWAHGPLTGSVSPISESKDDAGNALYMGLLAKGNDITSGTGFDVRMTFDKSLVSVASEILNNSKEDALDKIIELETKKADAANSKRTFIKVMYYGTYIIGSLYILGLIALTIYVYFKYDREHKIAFDAKYYREFTGDYNVEVVEYLMEHNISPKAMSASIMNLIYKKNIELEEMPDSKKDAKLILKTRDGINESESILLDLLFETVGSNGQVTLLELEKFSKKAKTAEQFMKKYNAWKNSVIEDGKKEVFFETHTSIKAVGTGYVFFGIAIVLIALIAEVQAPILYIAMTLISIIFLIYLFSFKKWSVKGREHYLKWTAFKNFLKDFGYFKDKEVPEIKLWEKYLVYATVFGLAKEVQKAMQVQLTELGQNEYVMTNPILFHNIYFADSISRSVSHTYSNSLTTINAANASSSMSSGGGFGGGTSFGGGGGFGGGGSSHGF